MFWLGNEKSNFQLRTFIWRLAREFLPDESRSYSRDNRTFLMFRITIVEDISDDCVI